MNSTIGAVMAGFTKCFLLVVAAYYLAGCAIADTSGREQAADNEPPYFPEQQLFKEANDTFLKWSAGDVSMWAPMLLEYEKLYGDIFDNIEKSRCGETFGKDSETSKRCIIRAITQQSVAVEKASGDDVKEAAFSGYKMVMILTNKWNIKPEPHRDYPRKYSSDLLLNAAYSLEAAAWRAGRYSLEEKHIITSDPICVAYDRAIPHYMKAGMFNEAATAAQSFLDYCQIPDVLSERERRHRMLGLLADAQAGAKQSEKAIAAAKDMYYLLPDEATAKKYLQRLNTKKNRKEVTNVEEFQDKILKKINRWLDVNPPPDSSADIPEKHEFYTRKASLYKYALAAMDKMGLAGYDAYLLFEFNRAKESADVYKGIVKLEREQREAQQRSQDESDRFTSDMFNMFEGLQKMRSIR